MRLVALCGLVIGLGSGTPVASAQAQAARYLLSGGGSLVRLQSTAGTAGSLDGFVIGGSGRASAWRLELEAGYAEGRLKPASGTLPSRDLVEGEVMLGVRPVPWLVLRGGPHARGYVQGGVTERWLLWEARARVDAFVAAPTIRGYLEVGGALSGSTLNATGRFGNSRRGEAGVIVRVARAPVWFSLAYGVERTRLASGIGLDALERVSASIGLGAGR